MDYTGGVSMSKQKIRDKKEIIIAMREAGKSRREITENRGLTKEQVKNWENRYNRRIQKQEKGISTMSTGHPQKNDTLTDKNTVEHYKRQWGSSVFRAAQIFDILFSNPLPPDAMGDVGDFDTLGLELVADTVGLGKVFGLFGVLAGLDPGLHFRVGLAGFGDDGKLPDGDGLLLQLLPLLIGPCDKVKAQHPVKVRDGGELGVVVGLVLEHVIQGGDGQGCLLYTSELPTTERV